MLRIFFTPKLESLKNDLATLDAIVTNIEQTLARNLLPTCAIRRKGC